MSSSIETLIPLYGDLSPAEQVEIEAYVDAYPSLRPLLEDAKRVHALAEHAADASIPDADELAAALMAEYVGPQSEAERALVARVQAAIEADDALRVTYDQMRQRLRDLHEPLPAPLAHFEALTGHTLPGADSPAESNVRTMPRRASDRTARQAAQPRRQRSVARWAFAAVVVLAAVGLGVIAAGPVFTPDYQKRADLASLTAAVPILRAPVRGGAIADSADTNAMQEAIRLAYADALALVEAARTTGTFGLRERYDNDQLDQAAIRLRNVTTREAIAPDLALDAEFAVGTIRLYQDRRSEACSAFERVVREQGPRSGSAEALIAEFCNE